MVTGLTEPFAIHAPHETICSLTVVSCKGVATDSPSCLASMRYCLSLTTLHPKPCQCCSFHSRGFSQNKFLKGFMLTCVSTRGYCSCSFAIFWGNQEARSPCCGREPYTLDLDPCILEAEKLDEHHDKLVHVAVGCCGYKLTGLPNRVYRFSRSKV